MKLNRNTFFKTLYEYCDGWIEFRPIPVIDRHFFQVDDIDQLEDRCQQHADKNLFFGVATRDGNGGEKKNVVEIPAVWCDNDLKITPKSEIKQRAERFPFNPSAIVFSGGGYHFYWILQEPEGPEAIDQVEDANRRIAYALGGDFNSVDAARILRIPSTKNHK
jgi:putative DNA primase/helicase